MPDFNRTEYITSYIKLCMRLAVRPFGGLLHDGDQFFFDGRCHVVHDGTQELPLGAVWLPGIFDWLELLERTGHPAIAIENVPDSGWYVYPIGNRDDHGSGITREIALARLWSKVNKPT
ncbi:MAG TPA: hypothetical protein VGG31_09015 [Candidatus Dormibacteraeota bacterium]|jgi:hypothetical protein